MVSDSCAPFARILRCAICQSSCCRRAPERRLRSRASRRAPTTISRSPSQPASSWRGSRPISRSRGSDERRRKPLGPARRLLASRPSGCSSRLTRARSSALGCGTFETIGSSPTKDSPARSTFLRKNAGAGLPLAKAMESIHEEDQPDVARIDRRRASERRRLPLRISRSPARRRLSLGRGEWASGPGP